MLLRALAVTILARSVIGQVVSPRRKRGAGRPLSRWERWISEPRSTVLFILFSVLVIGGGRRLLQGWKARGAIGRLDDPAVTPETIAAAADHGRAGLIELFRLLGSSECEPQRDAAGHALSVLWARDELIAEEEKALVRRGYQVQWKARRRYPRALRAPIPVAVTYGVPFLRDQGEGVRPEHLEWSHKVVGARRESLLEFSPWTAGPGSARFEMFPDDFETDGPHKLVLQTRVRTRGLTESWELELPHVAFIFEFDPRLAVDALFALPDETRAVAIAAAVKLGPGSGGADDAEHPPYLPVNETLAIKGSPTIDVKVPLPCDLAHRIEVEYEGVPGRFNAGVLTLSGQGQVESIAASESFPISPRGRIDPIPAGALERPGRRSICLRLVPDPDQGWADPDIRSIWPEAIETNWLEVEIVRR